jgi:membrane-associated phospholipid phosphatase
VLVGAGVAGLVGLDILLRARALSQRFPPSRGAMRRVRRERWSLKRCLVAGSALAGFYVTYMAYRNLKAIVPLVRPHVNFDGQLSELDRSLFGGGTEPAILLHRLLGEGIPTHVLSTAYVAFIVFLPLTIGVSLAFARELQAAVFYTAAQSINWILGAISYFLLPSLGPAYADPGAFAALPYSEVTRLQGVLLDQRVAFLHDPSAATPQSIAAFASLHISMSFTAALAAHLLGAGRRLKIALWTWLAITCVGTVYLGWHYVLDDIAGLAMGALALAIAVPLTGIDLRTIRARRPAAPMRHSGLPSAEPVR